jgi:cell division protein ZapE
VRSARRIISPSREAVETLMIDDVPLLGRARYDAARRFVMLIDVLYEAKRRLIVSGAMAETG